MIPKKIYLNYVNDSDFDNDVEITWSEIPIGVAGCKMLNREYTDLSQVWHDASEEPEHNCTIAYATKNNKIGTLKRVDKSRWGWYKEKYSILMWAYVDELLPKGGEK